MPGPVMERPPQPRYVPGRCYALKHPDDTSTHCMAPARLYPVGSRCDAHRPGVSRPQTAQEAA
jgi:hypothetical protein